MAPLCIDSRDGSVCVGGGVREGNVGSGSGVGNGGV